MKRALDLSWKRGADSPEIHCWRLQSKKGVRGGFSVVEPWRCLRKNSGRWVHAFGSTRISTVTCVATIVVCALHPLRHVENLGSRASGGATGQRRDLVWKRELWW